MSVVEKKLARSLSAQTTDLIPFLPYLLQDLWEMGSYSEDMIEMIKNHVPDREKLRALDLACGKGAVSVKLAKAIGCHVRGIDIMPDFIVFAQRKAMDFGVLDLCDFFVEDINLSVENERGYDLAILAAAGDVLGKTEETICKLKKTVKPGGFILIDCAYRRHGMVSNYPTYDQLQSIFRQAEVGLIEAGAADENYLLMVNNRNNNCIIRRANELKIRHPDKTELFDGYIDSQLAECFEIMNNTVDVTWLLKTE